jgi:hypothetical protein
MYSKAKNLELPISYFDVFLTVRHGIDLFHLPEQTALQSALIRRYVQPFTESDDTRRCDNTICPPEDGHVDARNMSRIVM